MNEIVILGGPNGAGKTTAAKVLLPSLSFEAFLNADEFARQLPPGDAELTALRAGRLMLERMRELVRAKQSFTFETTCSGKSYLRMLRECQKEGWRVSLLFLWLPSAEDCIRRVRQRVRAGGHSIPEDVIRRRYAAGLVTMRDFYLPLANAVRIYDNSEMLLSPVAEKDDAGRMLIDDETVWSKIFEANCE